ncbi:MAG: SLC13 family permease [Wenzhouxiangella sp.]|jgi:di/tricarboxylate transporter|nr:SLC13 family permease [Wenzhouxiangella sp.]
MTADQLTILAILLVTVILFIWGRWRHDLVAASALLACVIAGLVPGSEAFEGFGHPAVITVACVLILSRALQVTGAVNLATDRLLPRSGPPWAATAGLVVLAAVLSAFMNNVGALALLMPVAVQLAQRYKLPPGQVLMPLAFGSILGGMTTLIGTPPNLIVSGFRADTGMGSFAMFDFTPVGLAVAVSGVAFVLLAGRWLIPVRERADLEDFNIGDYLTEARVQAGSKSIGLRLAEAERKIEDDGAQIIGLIRHKDRIRNPHGNLKLRAADILLIEATPKALIASLNQLDIQLEADRERASVALEDTERAEQLVKDRKSEPEKDNDGDPGEDDDQPSEDEDITLMEVVVMPISSAIGRSASSLKLRSQLGINLLAVSRHGRRTTARLRRLQFRPGDVLLMQGPREALLEFASNHACVPLADRALRIPRPRQALIATLVMVSAVTGAAFGLLPAAITFAAGVVALAVSRVIPPRKIYDAIDWPVIVLLGALIPVANAMATSGTADLLAGLMLEHLTFGSTVLALTLILVVTMTLSDFMNNAATAAVMCPIAISTADTLGVNPDAFLMAVAVGASCAFLTPIGHQNNTLILGPGGFRFGDYWRLGLPVEVIVVVVSVPMILMVWPL